MSSRLPDTELANLSFLPVWQKRAALVAFEQPKKILGSYEPFRRVFPDAINQQTPLFGEGLKPADWDSIKRRLRSECKGNDDLIAMNEAILHSTHRYANEHILAAFSVDVPPLRLVGAHFYNFGLPIVIRYKDRASFAFLDLRRSSGLSLHGRRFVFSMMHERFRAGFPDNAEADLEIWRYQNNRERTLVSQRVSSIDFTYDEMIRDAFETYEILESIRRGDRDSRRAAGGSAGPLFD